MKKLLLTLAVVLSTLISSAPSAMDETLRFTPSIDYFKTERDMEIYNLLVLEDNTKKSREEVFHLVQPIIELYLKQGEYKFNFPYMQDSISYALACIFVSESSNSKGHTARSSLWLTHKNPFGLTGREGVTKTSWEMIDGKKVVMPVTFRTFSSFRESFESLLWEYLFKDNFFEARQSESVKDFLHNLYKGGYMTNSHWPDFAYNEIYLKALKYEKK